jgi:hypothetical protein
MKWHKKLLIIVLLISFIVGLGSFGMSSVSAAAPATPIPLTPQGYVYLCDSVLHNVNFRWTSVAGATYYTIQLSSVSDFSTVLVNYTSPATEFYLSGINLLPGIYYWRVLAGNSDGSSLWTVKSFDVIPSPPVLVSPLSNGFVLPNTTFVWTTCYPFDTEFQLSNRPDFATLLIGLNFNANQGRYTGPYVYEYKFSYPLSCGMYWWRVRTKVGTEFSPGVSQLFVVIVPPSVAPTIIAPTKAIISSTTVTLNWSYINNADRYQIQMCRGNNAILDTVIYNTDYSFIGEDNTTYCFRVRAGNPVGWGPWSEWRQFTILLPPVAPRIMYPNNNAVFRNNAITIDWTRIDTAETYTLEITDFTTHAVFVFNFTNNTCQFTGEYQHSYGVKVKAINQSGESSWSNAIWFRIEENIPPVIVVNSLPDYTKQKFVTISGNITDNESGLASASCNGTPLIIENGKFNIQVPLTEGSNMFRIVATDKAGNSSSQTVQVILDTIPPEITVTQPHNGDRVIYLVLKGSVADISPVTLSVNNKGIFVDPISSVFVVPLDLKLGSNQIHIIARDAAGNETTKILTVTKIPVSMTFILQVGNPIMKQIETAKDGETVSQYVEIDHGRGTAPIVKRGRMLVPIRSLIEAIGGQVFWDAESQKVTISVGRYTVELWIGKNQAMVNGYLVPIYPDDPSVTPIISNGRTVLPLRFIAENLGATVNWNEILEQAIVTFAPVPKTP